MVEKGALTQEELDILLGTGKEEIFRFEELEPEPEPEPEQKPEPGPAILSAGNGEADSLNMQLLLDIPLEIVVELGRTKKRISEVLELTSGSIVELEKMAGEPVDVYVNNKLVAIGEVVVIEEHFGVRIKEIMHASLK